MEECAPTKRPHYRRRLGAAKPCSRIFLKIKINARVCTQHLISGLGLGFLVEEDLAAHVARIAIPAFTRGKTQLSALDVERTRRLVQVRIHVERAMERLKNFSVISSVLPRALVTHTDNIMACSALSNLQPLLVK